MAFYRRRYARGGRYYRGRGMQMFRRRGYGRRYRNRSYRRRHLGYML